MRKLPWAVAVAVTLLVGFALSGCSGTITTTTGAGGTGPGTSAVGGDAGFARAFADRSEGLELEGRGTVIKLLTDDTEGDRHQRFIVRLDSGQTLLISHNIDVAPRVDGLQVGDVVSFKGEYVWNVQGGLLHWTHHDPMGSHPGGWLRRGDRTYQ